MLNMFHHNLLLLTLVKLSSLFLLPLLQMFSFSAPQSIGICSPCLDGNCPSGLSCNSNNCCINSESSSASTQAVSTSSAAPPSSTCKDSAASNLCGVYKRSGRCLQRGFILWLMVHCKSTCGLCTARIVPIG